MKVRTAAFLATTLVAVVTAGAQPAVAQFPGTPGRFVSTVDGLSTYARDGSGPSVVRLGARLNGTGIEYPSYGPKGDAIVFDASRDGDPDYEIYRVKAKGGKAVQLTHNGRPDWGAHQGPDAIAFVCDRGGDEEVCTMDLDGSRVRQITDNTVADWNPKWVPDGSRIVFSSNRHGTGMDIYSMKPDGSGVRRLTHNMGDELEPDVSPNGRKIVFWSGLVAPGYLVVMNLDGTHQNILDVTAPYPGEPRTPVWSPNGERIAFGTSDQIWTRTPDDDTSKIKVVVMSGAGNNIGWQPRA